MKITIEAETEEEKKKIPEPFIWEHVVEYGLTGTWMHDKLFPQTMFAMSGDKDIMVGKAFELIERIRKLPEPEVTDDSNNTS